MTEEARPFRRQFTIGVRRRIKSKRDFDRVFALRRRAANRVLSVFFDRASGPNSRLGLSVGRRFGGAVQRNRIKRVLREVFRLHQHHLIKALDLVFVPMDGLRVADFHQAEAAFVELIEKINTRITSESAP